MSSRQELIITDEEMKVLKNHYYNHRAYTTDAMLDLWHDLVEQIVVAETGSRRKQSRVYKGGCDVTAEPPRPWKTEPQRLYSGTLFPIMSFENMRRNAFRFRRANARPRVTNKNSHTLEIYEALEAKKLGLDEKNATPLKV